MEPNCITCTLKNVTHGSSVVASSTKHTPRLATRKFPSRAARNSKAARDPPRRVKFRRRKEGGHRDDDDDDDEGKKLGNGEILHRAVLCKSARLARVEDSWPLEPGQDLADG